MQMKIIISFHVYLFLRQLNQTAVSIALTGFLKKEKAKTLQKDSLKIQLANLCN